MEWITSYLLVWVYSNRAASLMLKNFKNLIVLVNWLSFATFERIANKQAEQYTQVTRQISGVELEAVVLLSIIESRSEISCREESSLSLFSFLAT
jgi:hypothetical protein